MIPHDFEAEALYAPGSWHIHELLEVDLERKQIQARMDTTRLGELVDAQIEINGHARHVPAALVIQATGTLGQLWAVYGLGLRTTQGWYGFGTAIKDARFHRMGEVGPPVTATVTCTRQRQLMGTWFCEFDFAFEQAGRPFYTSKQTAAWRRQDNP